MSAARAEAQNPASPYSPSLPETMKEDVQRTGTEDGLHVNGREDEKSIMHEMIASRAYELYMQRQPEEGDALTDWLQAEYEIRAATGTNSQPCGYREPED